MRFFQVCALMLVCALFWWSPRFSAMASELIGEHVTTTPVVDDGVLYVASFEAPVRRGHLRAIDICDIFPFTLWDAADRIPLPGVGANPGESYDNDPPQQIARDNLYRSLFTNQGAELLPLVGAEASRLQAALGCSSTAAAESLIHTLRGRTGANAANVLGTGDAPQRLWAISRSSPALVGRSPLPAATAERDRVLYVGAEDGLLHAFHAGRWQVESSSYLIDDPDGGVELWAYLPGSFLPHVQTQPFTEPERPVAVHLDGSPAVGDFYLDPENNGRRRWQTLLLATGTITAVGRSCLFVLDITDPYHPQLLWEHLLPGDRTGRTRGVISTFSDATSRSPRIYLTTDFSADAEEPAGINACALDLVTGQLLWQFRQPYVDETATVNATPAVPALMDVDADQRNDTLLFGDMAGRLWALNLADGQPLGGAPAYTVPSGVAEPIGAGVAVNNNLAVFGTGGAAHADDHRTYSIYAVEILPSGSQLLWSYELDYGEKVWSTPTFDPFGHLLFTTALDYLPADPLTNALTSGRMIGLTPQGEEKLDLSSEPAAVGRVVTAPGVTVSVSLTGEVTQLGIAQRLSPGAGVNPGSVKVLSWRLR